MPRNLNPITKNADTPCLWNVALCYNGLVIIDCGILNPQRAGDLRLEVRNCYKGVLIGHYHILQHVFNMLPLFSQFLPIISGTNHWVDNGIEGWWKGHTYFRGKSYCQNLKVNHMVKLMASVEFPWTCPFRKSTMMTERGKVKLIDLPEWMG